MTGFVLESPELYTPNHGHANSQLKLVEFWLFCSLAIASGLFLGKENFLMWNLALDLSEIF